jgi:hypothetical protein
MKNGLYRIQFQTPLGIGAGVLTLIDGTIRGGDSALYYVGSYQLNGNSFTATVHTGRHSGNQQSMPSVFGKDSITVNAQGTNTDDSASVTATSPQAPGVSMNATLSRIAD